FSALSAMICVRPLPLRDCLCGSRLHGRERRRCGRQAQDPTRSRQTPRSEERLRPLASPMGGRARFWLAVSIPPISERLRAITGTPGRSTLSGLRYSDVKERRGNTDLKLITRSRFSFDSQSLSLSIDRLAVLRVEELRAENRSFQRHNYQCHEDTREPAAF